MLPLSHTLLLVTAKSDVGRIGGTHASGVIVALDPSAAVPAPSVGRYDYDKDLAAAGAGS